MISRPFALPVCFSAFYKNHCADTIVELGAFAKLEPEFAKRGVKLIGISANSVDSHHSWIKDIDEVSGSNLSFPIIGDKQRKVAYLYDMSVSISSQRHASILTFPNPGLTIRTPPMSTRRA